MLKYNFYRRMPASWVRCNIRSIRRTTIPSSGSGAACFCCAGACLCRGSTLGGAWQTLAAICATLPTASHWVGLHAHDAAWRHRCRCLDAGRFVSHRPAWYFSTGYGLNKAKYAAVTSTAQGFRNGVDQALWANSGRVRPTAASSRVMPTSASCSKVGVGYQLTPQLNLGACITSRANNQARPHGIQRQRVNFYVAVADYAFSKAHRRLLWRRPHQHQRRHCGGAPPQQAQPHRTGAWYSSPLLITGGEKRCSGNRWRRFQGKTGSTAGDGDPVFFFGKIQISRAAKNQKFAPNPQWARDEGHFSGACSGGDGWHLFLHAGVKDLSFSAVRARKPSFVARNFPVSMVHHSSLF